MVEWQSVCSRCGKTGPKYSKPGDMGKPSVTPYHIGGKCPNSADGKHKPKWEKA
ncbi:MAG: hypothetical protein II670_12630 [Alphaproteobacteria bacterium]|nr:hypothetical protein [Alphaproteobacteria bacterium]